MITPKDLVLIIALVYLYLGLGTTRTVQRKCPKGRHMNRLTVTDLGNEDFMFKSSCPHLQWPDCVKNCTWQRSCERTKEFEKYDGERTYAAGLKIQTNKIDYSEVYCCHSEGLSLRNCEMSTAKLDQRIRVDRNQVIADIVAQKGSSKTRVLVKVCDNRPVELPMCLPEDEQQENQKQEPERNNKLDENNLKPKKATDDEAAALAAAIGLPLGVGLGVGLPLGILALITTTTTTTTTAAPVQCTELPIEYGTEANVNDWLFEAVNVVAPTPADGPWDAGVSLGYTCNAGTIRSGTLANLNTAVESLNIGEPVITEVTYLSDALVIAAITAGYGAGGGSISAQQIVNGTMGTLLTNLPCAPAIKCNDDGTWTDDAAGVVEGVFCLKTATLAPAAADAWGAGVASVSIDTTAVNCGT